MSPSVCDLLQHDQESGMACWADAGQGIFRQCHGKLRCLPGNNVNIMGGGQSSFDGPTEWLNKILVSILWLDPSSNSLKSEILPASVDCELQVKDIDNYGI